MVIAFVIETISSRGGMERIIIDKMNYLAEYTGHEVVLFTIWHDSGKSAFPIHNRVRRICLNVPILHIPYGYVLSIPLAVARFNKYIHKISPSVTVFYRAMGAVLSTLTSWKGKKIFESHTPFHASNHKWLYPFMQKAVDAVVCLTSGDANEYKYAKCVMIIPNFTLLKTEKVPDYKSRKVVFVGRKCPEKDFPMLYRIWEVVRKKYPDWDLNIHTDTSDIVNAYLEGSILIMTSKVEGFGLVLIEAMSCGLPCVAFDCPYGPADVIEDGKSGYLIPPGDYRTFAEKLMALMDDEVLRRTMGKAGKELSRKYQPSHIMSIWLKFFTEIYTSQK